MKDITKVVELVTKSYMNGDGWLLTEKHAQTFKVGASIRIQRDDKVFAEYIVKGITLNGIGRISVNVQSRNNPNYSTNLVGIGWHAEEMRNPQIMLDTSVDLSSEIMLSISERAKLGIKC